jgi:hypothetical protein
MRLDSFARSRLVVAAGTLAANNVTSPIRDVALSSAHDARVVLWEGIGSNLHVVAWRHHIEAGLPIDVSSVTAPSIGVIHNPRPSIFEPVADDCSALCATRLYTANPHLACVAPHPTDRPVWHNLPAARSAHNLRMGRFGRSFLGRDTWGKCVLRAAAI